jgi:asparagine synthase (glutamine-hydrolysing)
METLDQPSLDGLNTYIVSKAVRDAGIIVALSGLGGDELFGGYPAFTDVPKLYRLNARMQGFSPGVRRLVMGALGVGKPATVRAKLQDIGSAGPDLLRLYLHRRRANSDETLQSLGLDAEQLGLDTTYQPFEAIARAGNDDEDHVAAISRYESQFFMGCMLLRDSDATSMQHSMEIRVPFLDRRVLDLAYSIPGDVRLPGRTPDKHLLRVAYSKYLRPELLKQGKRGFTLPIRRWMLTSLRPMCEEGLVSLKATGLVNERGVDAIWREFQANPEHRVWSHAFLLCVLGMYLRREWPSRPHL